MKMRGTVVDAEKDRIGHTKKSDHSYLKRPSIITKTMFVNEKGKKKWCYR